MRRFWITLLAVSVALVIALPAGAVKPPKPPKPSNSAPVAAYLDAGPMWVHEVGDVIWYSVTVQNKTSDVLEATIHWTEGTVEFTQEVEITEPRGVAVFDDRFSYEVTTDDFNSGVDIVTTVTVTYDGGEVIAETSTLVDPVDECIFEVDGVQVVTESGLCIWKPQPGIWELSAVPDPDQLPKRPTNMMMTMRDGVPGNWCTLDLDGTGGVVQERWLPKSPTPIVLDVYLPGVVDDGAVWIESGMCLTGGHGVCTEPDCYFAVGTPESFYLYTTFDGIITLTGPGADA